MEKITTRNLEKLLDIGELKKFCQSLATIDLILDDSNEGLINYSFDSSWSKEEGLMLGSYFDQSNRCDIFFYNNLGAIIIGYERHALMVPQTNGKVWPGVIDNVPPEFIGAVNSAHLDFDGLKYITFCVWKKFNDSSWKIGNINFPKKTENIDYSTNVYEDPDGSESLLYLYDGNREKYLEWFLNIYGPYENSENEDLYAEDGYFDEPDDSYYLDLELVNYIFDQKPLTNEIIKKINPRNNFDNIKENLIKIGYSTMLI
jgi:hypothetical protein